MAYSRHSVRGSRSANLLPILCFGVAMAAAIVLCVFFGLRSRSLQQQADALQQQLEESLAQTASLQQQLAALQEQLDKADTDSDSGSTGDSTGESTGDNTGDAVPAWKPTVDENAPSYQLLYPDFYADQPYDATYVAKQTIYLTFDDGPSQRTDEILDILKDEGIKATFFVMHQSNTEAAATRMQRIVAEGHTLAMHTYSHQYKEIYASVDAYLDDAYKIWTEIKEATGVAPSLFRCPGGSRNSYNQQDDLYLDILAEMKRRGFVSHDWNLSVEDAVNPPKTAQELVDFCFKYLGSKTRGVVLMHDSKARTSTVEALPMLIQQFRDKGFTFAPLTPDVKPYLLGQG